MLRHWIVVAAAVICGSPALAADYRPDFDPSLLKGPPSGAPNEVLVLGTPHLANWPASFTAKALEPLVDRLAAWKPQVITVEALSGPQCDFMRRYAARYADSVEAYCWDSAPARQATGLDVPAAAAESDRLLATWPSSPTPAQRRHLAAVLLAAGDQASGLVQWLRLEAGEQRAGDGLDEVLTVRLQTLTTKRNETFLIAAALAARLGLERVYPVDDHTADAGVDDEKAFGEAMQRIWDNPAAAKVRATDEALAAQVGTGAGVLAAYRAYNAPGRARLTYESDFGAAMNDRSTSQYGRNYVGYWETRNLRMVANIRDVLGMTPGKRALVIVGASHKGYIDAYLNMMHDVRLADAATVLH
jgi:Family of unknown function (DUF5694)